MPSVISAHVRVRHPIWRVGRPIYIHVLFKCSFKCYDGSIFSRSNDVMIAQFSHFGEKCGTAVEPHWNLN